MRRLYFLVPDVSAAQCMVDDLLLARVPETSIHILARAGTPLGRLPEAGMAQRSDLLPALERGAALGGVTGTLAGLIAIAVPGAAVVSSATMVVGLALGGSAIGAWLGGMIGVSVDSPRLKQFEAAIANGELLLMVDVAAVRVAEIEALVRQSCPVARPEGVEPHIPAFP